MEDDKDLSHVVALTLAGNATVVLACTLAAAEALLRSDPFSLLLLDLAMPDGSGLTLLDRLRSITAHPMPVVILSASEVTRDVEERMAAALVKSRVSATHVAQTILSLMHQPRGVSPR